MDVAEGDDAGACASDKRAAAGVTWCAAARGTDDGESLSVSSADLLTRSGRWHERRDSARRSASLLTPGSPEPSPQSPPGAEHTDVTDSGSASILQGTFYIN